LGFTVVSGMARGIDGTAHETSLNAGGRTIAVLGSGVDRVYPAEHDKLYQRISEAAPSFRISDRHAATGLQFSARNRLIRVCRWVS
jgi:DNA processing protein